MNIPDDWEQRLADALDISYLASGYQKEGGFVHSVWWAKMIPDSGPAGVIGLAAVSAERNQNSTDKRLFFGYSLGDHRGKISVNEDPVCLALRNVDLGWKESMPCPDGVCREFGFSNNAIHFKLGVRNSGSPSFKQWERAVLLAAGTAAAIARNASDSASHAGLILCSREWEKWF